MNAPDSFHHTLDAALERAIVHAVMYRDYKIGTLCDSQAWGPAMLFTTITDHVTCPGCRAKLDGIAPAYDQRALVDRVGALVDRVSYRDGYRWIVDTTPGMKYPYLQIAHWRPDAVTGVEAWGQGDKAYISAHATDSEIFQTMLGLAKAYEEHEVREFFLIDGKRPFGPHISTEALCSVADQYDARPTEPPTEKGGEDDRDPVNLPARTLACPRCGHQVHSQPCLNIASDNDCDCPGDGS